MLTTMSFVPFQSAQRLPDAALDAYHRAHAEVELVIRDLTAPRGALLYLPRSGEGLEVTSLGPMAYLDSKEEGDNSMVRHEAPDRIPG